MSLFVDLKKKVKGFSLDVCFKTNNEHLGIVGESGSGKSMTLKCIAGVEIPDEGFIELNGRVLFDSENKINLKPQERNVGYLFQNYALFPNMTVEENIGAGLKLSKSEKKIIVDEMINKFSLGGLEKKYPGKLSGGQQQRVALARCIVYKPDVLMLDEPFSALDTHLKKNVQEEVAELLKYYYGEVLIVTHSLEEVYEFSKNLLIIEDGKSIICNNTKTIFNDPKNTKVAKIMGCENISRCKILEDNSIYAIDLNMTLYTNKNIKSDIMYIGIHSHSFEISNEEEYKTEKNVFKCKIIKIVEEIFICSIYLKNIDLVENNKKTTSKFKVSVKKEQCQNWKIDSYIFVKVPEYSILLLT